MSGWQRIGMGWCLATLATLLLVPSAMSAQGDQRLRNAINNTQSEMTACAVYYTNFAACLALNNSDEKTVEGIKKIAAVLIERGTRLAEEIELTPDAVQSRLKLAQQDQLNLINKDCINISSLISRYQDRCEFVFRDFKAVVHEYMK